MFLVKTEIRDSTIEGKGLFVLQHVPKGILIAIFTSSGAIVENLPAQALRYGVMSEQEYLHRMPDDEIVRYSGARYVGNWFVYKNQVHQEDFTNHSNDPNVLYHCGLGFAGEGPQPGRRADLRLSLLLFKRRFLGTRWRPSLGISGPGGSQKIDRGAVEASARS